MRFVLVVLTALTLSACATKHHGRISPMSEQQMFTMTCDEIDAGLAEVAEVERNIALNRRVDFRTVLGWAIDAGIGNMIARSRAIEAAHLRRTQLEGLRFERGCAS